MAIDQPMDLLSAPFFHTDVLSTCEESGFAAAMAEGLNLGALSEYIDSAMKSHVPAQHITREAGL